MKALILAGGRGKRLEEHAAETSKCMLPLAGRPLIEYSLDNCLRIGPDEIVIVVGHLAEQIINRYGNSYRGTPVRYAIQREQHGLVHAIETAEPALGDSDFMLFLADEVLLEPNHAEMVEEFQRDGAFAVCGVAVPRHPEAVRKTYAVLEGADRRVLRLVEKPRRALNGVQGTGNIILSHRILDYIATTPVHPQRNEKELPDLIQCAIDDGHVVKSFLVGGRYVNVNTSEDLALAEEELSGTTIERIPETETMDDAELAELYAAADLSDINQPLVAQFRRRFPQFAAGRLLDVGCGAADVAIRVAREFPAVEVHGVDASAAMLDAGRRAVQEAGLEERVKLEKRHLPSDALAEKAFDAVVSNSTLHHFADPAVLWQTVRTCARRGAPVVVTDLHRPAGEEAARSIVERYAAEAHPLLRQSFFDSLLAAYTATEVRRQLDDAGLSAFRVERIDDMHILVWGEAP